MKKEFTTPEFEVVAFSAETSICVSSVQIDFDENSVSEDIIAW